MNDPLDGKIILVTGAASGIGRATAIACADAGAAAVVVADVSVPGGTETVRLLHARDTDAIFSRLMSHRLPRSMR